MQRHKILTLTKTYLTLSLVEIANEAGLSNTREAEDILFDMISEGEIKAQQLRCNFWAETPPGGNGGVGWIFVGNSWGFVALFKGGMCWVGVLVYQVWVPVISV